VNTGFGKKKSHQLNIPRIKDFDNKVEPYGWSEKSLLYPWLCQILNEMSILILDASLAFSLQQQTGTRISLSP